MTKSKHIALTCATGLIGSPALAHHEVVVATSLMPVALPFIATCVAGIAVWRKGRKARKND